MCGRFANGASRPAYRAQVSRQLGREPRPGPNADGYEPTFNVSPGTMSPVVYPSGGGGNDLQLQIDCMRWGFPRPDGSRVINTRSDNPHAFGRLHRCVLFCQGFYEWLKPGAPHFTKLPGPDRLMPLAALYDSDKLTFSIVTTEANKQLEFLHDRMPVILPTTEAIFAWMATGPEWQPLLKPIQDHLECYRVPPEVGKVGNSHASFIAPLEDRKDGIKAFFNKQSAPPSPPKAKRSPSSSSPEPILSPSGFKDEPPAKRPRKASGSPPSSRFSPDPFNPPVSPPRPHGGYSRPGSTPSPRKSQSPTKPKGQRDIRAFFDTQQQ